VAGEFELIARYFTRPARSAALGIGDDCALLRPPAGLVLALTTDALLEGTHFRSGTDPRRLGHKALAVNLSDLAAMGADPRWFLLAIALPDADEAWLGSFASGLFALAEAHGIELIGGDTTRGPRMLTITAIGTLPPGYALRRDAAAEGDDVWLSGTTGEAALGLAHLEGRVVLAPGAAAACVARLERPEPRVALGKRLRGVAAAAIDVSDGLLADLGHVAERSRLAAELEYDAIPRAAALGACPDGALAEACLFAGGDDYELVFTAAPDRRGEVEAAGRAAGVAVTRIGRMAAGAPEVRLLDRTGNRVEFARRGFDHFGSPGG
jgi:thiamine-monophosphate kinase